MAKNLTTNSDYRQQGISSEPGGRASRLPWSRPRMLIFLGVALPAIILAIFMGGRFLVSQGQVAVAAGSQDDPLSSRAYQFTGQGKILGGSGTTWIIGGVPIQVSNQTQIENNLHPGDDVSVLGHISQDGKWLAEGIDLTSDADSFFSFGGPLEARSATTWKVAGISVTVNDQTQLGASLQDNELVLVTFKVLPDGTWLGLNIESLSALATPTPPSATSEPSANDQQSVSNKKPPTLKPAGNKDNIPGWCKNIGKGKGNGKHGNSRDLCSGSGQWNNVEGDD